MIQWIGYNEENFGRGYKKWNLLDRFLSALEAIRKDLHLRCAVRGLL